MSGADAKAARFARFLEAGGVEAADERGRRLQEMLFASGSLLPDLLIGDVTLWPALLADPWLERQKPAAVVFEEAERATRGAVDFDDFKRRLRLYRRREILRLGARELGWGTTEEVAAELSGFADACLELAYRFCDGELRQELGQPEGDPGAVERAPGVADSAPSFVVMAMGKLGGQELNFSSDIDVIYFYSTDAGQVVRRDAQGRPLGEPRTLHGYFSELSRRITEAIEEATPEGSIFRVDLRLRPEGRNGPLANSVAAAERYYETFGRTWERQALLRARPCAGDLRLGEQLLEILDAFIYPRHIAPQMIEDIRALRGQFRPKDERPEAGFDVKLGTGGIRDVELVVQTLQLVHGGKRRELRGQSTPRGLRRLQIAGLLSDQEMRALAAAYRFLRQVEHRLQVREGAQTHQLPADPAEREAIARGLGFLSRAAFDQHLAEHRADVQRIANTFDDPPLDRPLRVQRVQDPSLGRDELEALLAELGFSDREAAADSIELVGGRMPPAMLSDALASPDPDRALVGFRDLTLRGNLGLTALLRDHPQLQRMLATLFGVSERLSRLLVLRPDMWEPFVDGLGEPLRSPALLAATLDERLGVIDRNTADVEDPDVAEEADALALRRFQTEETLRIGLHDVSGNLSTAEVARQLSALAEVCLDRGLRRMFARMTARHGRPTTSLTVLGLGSLGGYEMRYGSDLDLVFLFGAEGQTSGGMDHRELFARLARRLLSSFGALLASGRLYNIDTALRPSGEQGMLVTSEAAFERYHQTDAASWERVALLRARVVFTTAEAADRAAFERTLGAIAYDRPFDAARFGTELGQVRARVEAERGRVLPGSRHLRFDPGGVMDLEFLAAFGQLAYGTTDPALRTTETNRALARLIELGWPATLEEDYALLRTLAMRMRLLRDRPEDVISPPDLVPLARTLELDPARLSETLDQTMKRVRACFLERFPT
jgi:glutamate-ammonia-ligase adenylyltransferase